MSYTVLARKYRPQTFAELVGQEHVARTLSNAIAQDRVAHAFLFTGVRGVGKTTTARLLAKALACETGPTAEPCNQCAPCKEIAQGVDMDVLEVDGASNNSVDDVRRLQETLPYRPARDRFKIVIVDEVHMLSQGAFNAFLKTLEEPPAHVKFIFATTESHKVPITIRSRCQRYDFRLIPQAVVADRVREILSREGIESDDAAVGIVAREAAGSMRDALTLLDQLVAFAGNRLVGEEVARVLGIADRRHVLEVTRALLEADGAAALRAVEALASQGADMLHFARQLLSFLRDLVVLRVAGDDADLVDLVPEERASARELAAGVDVLELQRAFAATSRLTDDVARAGAPRTVLEMGLVRIATRPALRGVDELLSRLEDLERRLGSGDRGGGRGSRGAGGRPAGPAPQARPARRAAPADAAPPTPSDDRPTPPAQATTAQPPLAPPSTPAEVSAAQAPAAPPSTPAEAPAEARHANGAGATAAHPHPTPSAADGTGGLEAWAQVLAILSETRPDLASTLKHAVPIEVGAAQVTLAFARGSFHRRLAEGADARDAIRAAAGRALGGQPTLELTDADHSNATAAPTMAEVETQRREDERRRVHQAALSHPRVLDAMQIFPERADQVQVRIED
jgi:DNA polymerase III subunit gamma/tau